MGTNYYLEGNETTTQCECCGQDVAGTEQLHIGKSSMGWCFSLHVTDECPDLAAWEHFLVNADVSVVDEYGEHVNPTQMINIMKSKRSDIRWKDKKWMGYINEGDFHQQNGSERGPNNLLRHSGNDNAGTIPCDYCTGEFS